jgi:hypothetical protein
MYDVCPPVIAGQNPNRDVCIVGCEPAAACLEDNFCAEGYRSIPPQFACAICDIGYYKRSNECVKCPNSPYALVIGFVALVVVGAAGAYVLNKKKINVGFIAIGVDWAQVIAIFAASGVAWPPIVKTLFQILSAFNLNIEVVAPECILPDLQYKQKWSFIMALPISLTVFFMLITAVQVVYRMLIKGKKVSLGNQGASFMSMTMLLMYVLYIYLTRNILDIFNCQPHDPDEGKLFLTAGTGEECYVPGGTQQTLSGPAAAAALFYIVGYPAAVAWLLYTNFALAMEDQLLRAKGVGDDKLSNPRAHVLRKRFSRIYYQFRPDCVYWILCVILRKFFLAATYILFNRNASFQLAAALLVIFVAYAAQMKFAPYMGPSDFDDVLKSWEQRAITGDHAAISLWSKLKGIESRGRKKMHRNGTLSLTSSLSGTQLLGILQGWLFGYNTVEEILLFSAGTVALMGIMYASLAASSSNFDASRDSVTWVIVGAIILTIIYFFTVVFTEVFMLYTEDSRRKVQEKLAKNRRGSKKASSDDDTKSKDRAALADATLGEANVGTIDTSFNPMFEGSSTTEGLREAVAATSDVPTVDLWRVFRQGYAEMQERLARLTADATEVKLRQQKMEAAAELIERATGQKLDLTDAEGNKFAIGRKKSAFGPVGAEESSGSSGSTRLLGKSPIFGSSKSPLVSGKSLRSLQNKSPKPS